MADEATTGNDQVSEETQNTGEGQTNAESERIARLEAELERTNAFAKQVQNQLHQQQQAPQDDDDDEVEPTITPEQRKLIKKIAGVDELQSKLSEFEKREQERQQAQQNEKLQNDLKRITEKYKDRGTPLPDTRDRQEELLRYMNETGIYNMDVAYREMHAGKLAPPAEKPKAAVSDRSDSIEPSNQDAYREALKKAQRNTEALAAVEAQFKGSPTN